MMIKHWGWFFLVISAMALISCGGSGSSGFESSGSAEQNAILKVTEEGGCEEVDGIPICAPGADPSASIVASDDASLTTDEGGTSGGIAEVIPLSDQITLSIEPASRTMVSCVQDRIEHCRVTARITPSNFSDETQFFVTTRFQNDSSWSPPILLNKLLSDRIVLEGIVEVGISSVTESASFQIAVLVYTSNSNFPQSGVAEQLLSRFQANVIYVISNLSLAIVAVP